MPTKHDQLLLEVLLQLGGKKKKKDDWITLASKMRTLVDQYPSVDLLSSRLQVSPHVIRSISSLTELPQEVKSLVRQGKILYDAAYRLRTLPTAKRQIEVARAIQGLTSHTQRAAIQYAAAHSQTDLLNFLERSASPKASTTRTHLVVVPIPDEEMGLLKEYCRSAHLTVGQAVATAVHDWVRKVTVK